MLKKILKLHSLFFISVFLISSIILAGRTTVDASQMDSMDNGDNPLGIVIEESNKNDNSPKITALPDLGDDQVFPFIAGLGSNEDF